MPELSLNDAYQLALQYYRQGQKGAAENLYQQILLVHPQHIETLALMGLIQCEKGEHEKAIGYLTKTLDLDPQHVVSHNLMARCYQQQGDLEKAKYHFLQAVKFKPDFEMAHRNLGNLYLQFEDYEKAVGHLDEAVFLKRGTPISRQKDRPSVFSGHVKKNVTSAFQLTHHQEQLRYLMDNGLIDDSYEEEFLAYGQILKEIPKPENDYSDVTLTQTQCQKLERSLQKLVYLPVLEKLPEHIINPHLDFSSLQEQYYENAPGILFFDGLLTDEALQAIRQFSLAATVWFQLQLGSYMGAYLLDGFHSQLLFAIASDMKAKLPKIFLNHPLRQMWGFKYGNEIRGTGLHADSAAVNVNFWITPDEANLDPERGGLVVYKHEAPKDWDFHKFNNDFDAIRQFLKENNSDFIRVPHRQNRAIIFNSDLFHHTDDIHFKPGYENRRVNVTMLFGDRRTEDV